MGSKKVIKFENENVVGVNTYVTGYAGNAQKFDRKFGILLSLALILLVAGIALILFANLKINKCEKDTVADKKKIITDTIPHACDYSEEAKRIKFGDFLSNLLEEYFIAFPEEIAWYPNADVDRILTNFKVHDPSAENIKAISVKAKRLLKEATDLKPDLSKLKPREHKAYLQLLHFLENSFANAYLNYTSGLWMLGPSSFCSEPMCYVGYAVHNSIGAVMPDTEEHLNFIMTHLKALRKSFNDYVDVLKMGILKGMVRTEVECRAGIDGMKYYYQNIAENGAKGVLKEWYVKKFLDPTFYENNRTYYLDKITHKKYGKNVSELIKSELVENIGTPVEHMLNYLKGEHYLHCRPNDYGPGGLSALPLNVLFYNGSKVDNSTTDPYLPLCNRTLEDCKLSGKKAYAALLGYFATKSIKPDEVYKLGKDNLDKLYPQVSQVSKSVLQVPFHRKSVLSKDVDVKIQVVSIAKSVTAIDDEAKAVTAFRGILSNLSVSYFNTEPLPENETSGSAFLNCNTEEKAKKNCPKRWATMMKWFEFSQMAISIHDSNTVNFFYFSGNLHSTPNCPVKLRPDFNPSSGAQSYLNSDANCTEPCYYYIPFFLENLGPKFSEYSSNAHEARPGHHTQVQGLIEHFRDKCGGSEAWLDDKTYYTAFTEGWALYAENPLIAQDTDIYKDNEMQKFGMLKWQIWRALRLIVDTGLHYKNMTRKQALDLFATYAWDDTDLSRKEVTRYQSNYGQATAYMIGQLDIWALRDLTEKELGAAYSIKEFHLQALSQGSSPLAYLTSYMKKFIACKKNPTDLNCDIVLNPTKASTDSAHQYRRNMNIKWPTHRHYI